MEQVACTRLVFNVLTRKFLDGTPDHQGGGGIYPPPPQAGAGGTLLSAAGSLESESKLQGEIDRCDFSYYQLFRCSFWVCFYGAVCRLKR